MQLARRIVRPAAAAIRWRPSIRVVLFLGFGLTFGLWLVASYQFARRVASVEAEASAVNERYLRAQELLSTVRAQILLGSVYVRDSLLDPDPAVMAANDGRLADTYRTINAALAQYVPVLEAPLDEQDRIANLSREIEEYRATMEQVLAGTRPRSSREIRRLLNEEVVPRRELVTSLADEVQALNRSAFVRRQQVVRELYRSTERQVRQQLGFALVASFGIGVIAVLYAGRLEARIRAQAAIEAKNHADLQQLSAKLLSLQEEERRAIARELHDEVGQALSAIKCELARAHRRTAQPGPSSDPIEAANLIADGALQTVRNLSRLLRPALLDDLGLQAAVTAYARDFEGRYGIAVDLSSEGLGERLAPDIETAAYRIVQEALTNVARHSRATRCAVRMIRTDAALELRVEDNGVGIAPSPAAEEKPKGFGLIGIRERVAEVGGIFDLRGAPGQGVQLRISLPAGGRSQGGAEAVRPARNEDNVWTS